MVGAGIAPRRNVGRPVGVPGAKIGRLEDGSGASSSIVFLWRRGVSAHNASGVAESESPSRRQARPVPGKGLERRRVNWYPPLASTALSIVGQCRKQGTSKHPTRAFCYPLAVWGKTNPTPAKSESVGIGDGGGENGDVWCWPN